jgi:hypothetical protein
MLGMSLGKFLLLAAIVIFVWYGFKYANRVQAVRRAFENELRRRQAAAKPPRLEAEDLALCGTCGAYVPARGAMPCGRPDCPWGR